MNTIPKICHLIWTKDAPMAMLQVFTVVSFHRYNPDWEIKIWVSKETERELGANVYVPDYTGGNCFDELRKLSYVEIIESSLEEEGINFNINPIVASDIRKRHLLYRYGGVYSDFDSLWLKPIDHIRNIECLGNPDSFEGIVSFYKYTHGHHNVSNLVSEPHSGFINSLMKIEKTISPPYDHQAFGTQMLNNAYPTLDSVTTKFPRMLAIKYETFYPYSTFDLKPLFVYNDLSPLESNNVICIHWFNGNGVSKDYLNTDSFRRECSMNSILKQEGYL